MCADAVAHDLDLFFPRRVAVNLLVAGIETVPGLGQDRAVQSAKPC